MANVSPFTYRGSRANPSSFPQQSYGEYNNPEYKKGKNAMNNEQSNYSNDFAEHFYNQGEKEFNPSFQNYTPSYEGQNYGYQGQGYTPNYNYQAGYQGQGYYPSYNYQGYTPYYGYQAAYQGQGYYPSYNYQGYTPYYGYQAGYQGQGYYPSYNYQGYAPYYGYQAGYQGQGYYPSYNYQGYAPYYGYQAGYQGQGYYPSYNYQGYTPYYGYQAQAEYPYYGYGYQAQQGYQPNYNEYSFRGEAGSDFPFFMDTVEFDKYYSFYAELPGVAKGDFELRYENGEFIIYGQKKSTWSEQSGRAYRAERYFGNFHRKLTLPADADTSKIEATFENGVLTVTCQKLKGPKATASKVTVK